MSTKSVIQIIILFLIILIIGGVYYEYFNAKKDVVEVINSSDSDKSNQIVNLEKKIKNLELENEKLNLKIVNNKQNIEINHNNKLEKSLDKPITNDEDVVILNETNTQNPNKNLTKNIASTEEVKNLVKDVEYISVDEKGNRFNLLATSAKSNMNNNDILDLKTVRGKITSDFRDTIYISSDFAQYNSINLNSKFYENVVINYQDKEINCLNFDINMETNKAIAYNNVVITDPNSIMKAGIVEFDLKTKNLNINPESTDTEIKVITN